jgi:hypothetical protein
MSWSPLLCVERPFIGLRDLKSNLVIAQSFGSQITSMLIREARGTIEEGKDKTLAMRQKAGAGR